MLKARHSISIVALLLIVFGSCNKKTTPVITSNTGKQTTVKVIDFNKDLQKINAKYARNPNVAYKPNGKQMAFCVGSADVVAGVSAGAQSWSWCALGPWGAFAAGAYTGLAALGGSAATYYGLGGKLMTGDSTGDPKGKIAAHSGSYSVADPYSNPMENVGIRHNQLMKIWASRGTEYSFTSATTIMDSSELNSYELLSLNDNSPNTQMYNVYYWAKTHNFIDPVTSNYTIMPYLNYALSDTSYVNVRDIFETFFEGIWEIDDISLMVEYINAYEDYFINETSLSAWEKETVLSGLAIAKHSYTMWDDALTP